MNAVFEHGNVRARCPGCGGALSTFFHKPRPHHGRAGRQYLRAIYHLMQCGGCGRGALATVYCDNTYHEGELADFHPLPVHHEQLPASTPEEIAREYREAEVCLAVGANRAAAAMFRSALEKTLGANGYATGTLQQKIDQAAADGLITEARKARAHEDVRSLGNDVLHDPWRPIDDEAVQIAHHYSQRMIEEFYDDRPTALRALREKGRMPPENAGS